MNGPFEIHFEIASFLHLNSKICKVKYHAVLPTLVMKLQVENVCLFTYVNLQIWQHCYYFSILTSNSIFWFGSWIHSASVEISWFFYHSDFTWNQFEGFQKDKIGHFYTIRRSEFLLFMNFCTFWRLNFNKLTKFRAPKVAKKQFSEDVHLLDSSNWFHVKTEWYENSETSTMWVVNSYPFDFVTLLQGLSELA